MAKTEDNNQNPESSDKQLIYNKNTVYEYSDDSNDSVASSKGQSNTAKSSCPHVNKSVDINSVKKNVTRVGGPNLLKCTNCRGKVLLEAIQEQELTLCLNCGACNCLDHSLEHFKVARSDPHSLFVNIKSWNIRCYQCDADIPAESGRLKDGIIKLKGHLQKSPKSQFKENNLDQESISDTMEPFAHCSRDLALAAAESRMKSLPSPRGLTNLGNTCFMNSVLQCLAQTPFLLEILLEISKPGEIVTVNIDENQNLVTELDKWGQLTEVLAGTLSQMTSGPGSPISPNSLLDALRKKCRQFIGYNQHDAHELLRQLLDNVKTEDLRRYQTHILKYFGLSTKVLPSEVDEKKKSLFKALNQKLLDEGNRRPDPVFRGTLVSTVQCTKCFHRSEVVESFLDLSLPVSFEKLQPPTLARRKNVSNENNENKPKSKHQKKKEKKAARRANKLGKNKKRWKDEEVKDIQRPVEEKKEFNESGYSSGKASSPVQINNKLTTILAEALNEINSTSPAQSSNSINEDNDTKVPIKQESNSDSPSSEGNVAAASSYLENSEPTDEVLTDNLANDTNNVPPVLFPTTKSATNEEGSEQIPGGAAGGVYEPETRFILVNSPSTPAALNAYTSSSGGSSEDDKEEDNDDDEDEAADGDDDSSNNEDTGQDDQMEEEEGVNATLQPREEYDDNSVLSCLSQFTACEILTGNNKVKCDACTDRQVKGVNSESEKKKPVYQTATKQLLINSPPPVLILHLKRFQASYTSLRKVSKTVTFPLVLDIGPFCSAKCQNLLISGQNKILYSLYGVVVHSGSLHGGHYIAYVKVRKPVDKSSYRRLFLPRNSSSPPENVNIEDVEQQKEEYLKSNYDWYCISDSSVHSVSQEQVLSKEAYLLFYERIF